MIGRKSEDRAGAVEEAARILALLAEPERLRVVSALVLGYSSVSDITTVTGVDARAVAKAIARLVAGELVVQEGDGYRFASEELKIAARLVAEDHEDPGIDAPPVDARILRGFLKGGRLTSIPTARAKRLVVLDYLAQRFEPGKRYSEKKVNEILAEFNDDTASLRRYLVDENFLTRERGYYWRSGGRFEIG
jgi:hypothetical protein